jgi:phage terminase small subunit
MTKRLYYIKSFNATKSYQKAYGCNYESAMRSASRMLRNVEIKSRIEELTNEIKQSIMLTKESIIHIILKIIYNATTKVKMLT